MEEVVAKIDALGRILIPKPLRTRLGLEAGRPVRIVEEAQGLRLVPLDEQVPVTVRDGLPVLTGEASGPLGEAVEEHRRRRLRELSGD